MWPMWVKWKISRDINQTASVHYMCEEIIIDSCKGNFGTEKKSDHITYLQKGCDFIETCSMVSSSNYRVYSILNAWWHKTTSTANPAQQATWFCILHFAMFVVDSVQCAMCMGYSIKSVSYLVQCAASMWYFQLWCVVCKCAVLVCST